MTKFKEIPMEKLVSRQIKLWDITYEPAKADTANQVKPCITIFERAWKQGCGVRSKTFGEFEG